MGNCFSDPSKPSGQGQRLGSGPSSPAQGGQGGGSSNQNRPATKPRPAGSTAPPQTLGGAAGGSGPGGSADDPRSAALAAAEARAQAAGTKGVSTANPKAGQLSAKLAAERRSPSTTQKPNERLMDAGQWN
ncbi:uncharacterized protein LOC62_01G000634 [Vanrija pseudolonga]|uniref:Uncharacterized protein n=1 Tax=Vanrija pseudolonga TaxID=143232 RepID=A0AAF0Y5F2_9TREE|nr:hypothetical protein LOC62_01G000634 [Vanrija pseudolonga]